MNIPKAISVGFYTILSLTIMAGCDTDKPGIYKNNDINKSEHERFQKLNVQLLDAVKANKPAEVENMMSKELLETEGNRRTLELINLHIQSGKYAMLDEFYIVNDTDYIIKPINTVAMDGTKYNLHCPLTSLESYIAFIVPQSKGDKFMLTAVYNKYDYGWRLTALNFKPYTMAGKTAPQLCLKALEEYNKGYLVDAYLTMRLANTCMQPSNLWSYPQRVGMSELDGKINNIIMSYTYPLVMEEVPTKPKIFEVNYQTNNEGIFPVIRYVSSIDISDTIALKKENDIVKKTIGKMFLGIDHDKKYIYFSAYDQLPKPKNKIVSFDMTDRL